MSNHVGTIDPPFIGAYLPRRDLYFMAKSDYFRIRSRASSSSDTTPSRWCAARPIGPRSARRWPAHQGTPCSSTRRAIAARTGSSSAPTRGPGFLARTAGVPVLPVGIWGTERVLPLGRGGRAARPSTSASAGRPRSRPGAAGGPRLPPGGRRPAHAADRRGPPPLPARGLRRDGGLPLGAPAGRMMTHRARRLRPRDHRALAQERAGHRDRGGPLQPGRAGRRASCSSWSTPACRCRSRSSASPGSPPPTWPASRRRWRRWPSSPTSARAPTWSATGGLRPRLLLPAPPPSFGRRGAMDTLELARILLPLAGSHNLGALGRLLGLRTSAPIAPSATPGHRGALPLAAGGGGLAAGGDLRRDAPGGGPGRDAARPLLRPRRGRAGRRPARDRGRGGGPTRPGGAADTPPGPRAGEEAGARAPGPRPERSSPAGPWPTPRPG